jgi:hypothetical protein
MVQNLAVAKLLTLSNVYVPLPLGGLVSLLMLASRNPVLPPQVPLKVVLMLRTPPIYYSRGALTSQTVTPIQTFLCCALCHLIASMVQSLAVVKLLTISTVNVPLPLGGLVCLLMLATGSPVLLPKVPLQQVPILRTLMAEF